MNRACNVQKTNAEKNALSCYRKIEHYSRLTVNQGLIYVGTAFLHLFWNGNPVPIPQKRLNAYFGPDMIKTAQNLVSRFSGKSQNSCLVATMQISVLRLK